FPDLRLADEGDAAGNLQLPAALDQLHLGLVDLALVRLEDGAAGVLAAALGLHAADDLHPGDRLALAVVLALVAGRVGLAGVDQLDDAALERAVGCLGDLDIGLGLAGLTIDGLPAADRRIGGHGGAGGQQHNRGQQGGENRFGTAHIPSRIHGPVRGRTGRVGTLAQSPWPAYARVRTRSSSRVGRRTARLARRTPRALLVAGG